MKIRTKFRLIVAAIVLAIILDLIFAPMILVWCINTLWGTSTSVTFGTWFAGHVIMLPVTYWIWR